MPVPLTQGKAFHVYCEIGIVVSGITAARGAAAAVYAPDFKRIAIANRADDRIVAPGAAGSRPVSHPTSSVLGFVSVTDVFLEPAACLVS